MSEKQELLEALKLAKDGKFIDSRQILVKYPENPQAQKLLDKVNSRILAKRMISQQGAKKRKRKEKPSKNAKSNTVRNVIICALIVLFFGCYIISVLPTPDLNSGSSPRQDTIGTLQARSTQSINSEYEQVAQRLRDTRGVTRIIKLEVTSLDDGSVDFYSEAIIEVGLDHTQLANDLLGWVSFEMSSTEFNSARFVIDDMYTAMQYDYDVQRAGWAITTFDSFNAVRARIATPTNTPRPRPTQQIISPNTSRGSSSSNSSNSSSSSWNCSGNRYNCSDLSCRQIRSYMNACPSDPSGLDGDNDGYACERQC